MPLTQKSIFDREQARKDNKKAPPKRQRPKAKSGMQVLKAWLLPSLIDTWGRWVITAIGAILITGPPARAYFFFVALAGAGNLDTSAPRSFKAAVIMAMTSSCCVARARRDCSSSLTSSVGPLYVLTSRVLVTVL